HETAVEALTRPQFLFPDLMAYRTGDPVLRFTAVLFIVLEWQVRKDLALLTAQPGFVARNRHVTDGTLVFDIRFRFRMIGGLPSNTSLPIGIARRVGHHTGAPA